MLPRFTHMKLGMINYVARLGILVVAVSAPQAVNAASTGFNLRLTVPIECELRADPLTLTADQAIANGVIFESCNDGAGFNLIVQHRMLAEQETLKLTYVDEQRVMNGDHQGAIIRRRGAKYGVRPMALEGQRLDSPVILTFSIAMI